MAKVTLKLSDDAETYLRKNHNEKRGDMADYVSNLILSDKTSKGGKS